MFELLVSEGENRYFIEELQFFFYYKYVNTIRREYDSLRVVKLLIIFF